MQKPAAILFHVKSQRSPEVHTRGKNKRFQAIHKLTENKNNVFEGWVNLTIDTGSKLEAGPIVQRK